MTERVLGPTGSPRRRWTLLLPLVAVIVVGLYYVTGAQAVHDLDFQLDGETTSAGFSLPNTNPTKDWNDIFNADGTNTSLVSPSNNPGFTHADFTRDFQSKTGRTGTCAVDPAGDTFCTADTTTYATGSKDTLDIPKWQCNKDNNVNSKIDIMNAYAAAYTASNGDRIIYFGMEKNKDNGTNDVGFWFLQGNADCSSSGPAVDWSGTHTVGDVLVVSEFSQGGGVSNVTAYKWVGASDPNGPLVPFGQGGDCKTAPTGNTDSLCATTNATGSPQWNTAVTTKWPTADATLGVGTNKAIVVPPDFFEGGINLTKVFTQSGGTAPSCFNTFVGDTRSSKETSATLFDYARGTLGECGATIQTTPSLTSTTLAATGAITDLANVFGQNSSGGAGPKPTGTISFFLCGPLTSADGCTAGGTAVGSAVTLGNCTPDVAGHSCATSGNVRSLVTAGGAGTYCFRAVYNPGTDPNYGSSAGILDGSSTECFTVTGTSSISSAQRWLPNDRVVLTGDSNLNGSLTVTLYSGDNCGVTSGSAVTGQSYSFTVTNGDKTGAPFNTTNTDPATAPNTTFYVGTKPDGSAGGATGNYSWLVHYDDNVLTDPADHCEKSSVSITN